MVCSALTNLPGRRLPAILSTRQLSKIFVSSVFIFLFGLAGSLMPSAMAQKMILETDKLTYAYGDTIEVHVSIYNDTNTTFTIISDIGNETYIGINDIEFEKVSLPTEGRLTYEPGDKRTWIWKLRPDLHGVPDREGVQTIYGMARGTLNHWDGETFFEQDSLEINAPKYLGGLMNVKFASDLDSTAKQNIRDSLNVEVSEMYDEWEIWTVSGYSIDSLSEKLTEDPRFQNVYPYRSLSFAENFVVHTSVKEVEMALGYQLKQNYPNPFNPVTTIQYDLPESTEITLKVFDLTGRTVAVLENGVRSAGTHTVSFEALDIASGLYIYQLSTPDYIESRTMILLK